ncbi:hypothetical protein TcWFU_002008 [Taenia crassiceps]|uniref:Uncharacterized protein n=1 Tax=Taenia crassiceps TaxID=6207 RepID=A0ABR4QPE7_9CEST
MDPQQVSNARKCLLKLLKTYTYAIACLLACSSGQTPPLLFHPLLHYAPALASSLPHLFLPPGTTPYTAMVDATVGAPTTAPTPPAWLKMVLRV